MNLLCYKDNYKKPLEVLECMLKGVDRKDIYIVGAGGNAINEYLKHNPDKIVISLFSGNVFNQPEAFISRLKTDLVLLNSINDYNEFKKICSIFNIPINGFLLGACWYKKMPNIKALRDKRYIVFFEQIDVPKTKQDRLKLLNKLCVLADANKNRNFLIKSREEYKSSELSLIRLSSKVNFPKNLNFTNIDTCTLIQNLDIGMSISSSTGIEALLSQKKYIVIGDFGYKNTYLGFYNGSGIISKFKDINLNKIPSINPKWFKENISNPYDNINELKNKLMQIQKTNITININIKVWLKLLLYYRKLFLTKPASTFKKIRKALDKLEGKNE
ncbi:polysialic acid biosynthesis protein NeuE [Campylobacter iguaniorum]|uniref:DUF6716 putative glycosyltransferase n=1 Tax=Campylobacter iguaniorum TaxID=1244531 RepID=UPI0007C8F354|nr:DUF6716 putative glycosyltransferase [Campylobacter iguaniorum]ANE35937.1 polysialic acid biosynthesis protein NeuE [Campylobacter iguaniorum]